MIILQGILKLLSWAIAARKDDVKENKKKVVKWAIATTSTSVKKFSCNIWSNVKIFGTPWSPSC